MLTEKLAQMEKLRADLAALEKEVVPEMRDELKALPAKYGFKTPLELYKAIVKAGRGRAVKPRVASPDRKPRVEITPEIKAQVSAGIKAGKTSAEMATATGISMASVANIRRAMPRIGT